MIKFGRGVPIASSATWSGLSDERRASQARAGRHGHRALRRASRSGDDPDRPQAGGRPRGGHDVRPLLLTGLWWVAYSLEVHNLPSLLSAVLGLLAPAYGLLVLWRVRQVGRGVAFVLVAGLVVTFLEEELTPRAMGVTAAVGAAGTPSLRPRGCSETATAQQRAPRSGRGPWSPSMPWCGWSTASSWNTLSSARPGFSNCRAR